MYKLSHDEMIKVGYDIGRGRALLDLGVEPEMLKQAYVEEGWHPDDADYLVKEAVFGAIAKGVGAAGKAIASGMAKAAPAMKNVGQNVAKAGGNMVSKGQAAGGVMGGAQALAGKAVRGVGGAAGRLGKQVGQASQAMAHNPGQAFGQGLKQFGKGALTGRGTGLGGTLGKATLAGGTAKMFGDAMKGPQMQQQQMMQPGQMG